MAVNEMQGSLLLHEFRVAGSSDPWLTLVCEQGGRVRSNTNVTTEKTKCGPIKGIDAPDWSMSGDAVANMNPGGTEASLTQIMDWIQSTVLIEARVQSPVEEGYTIGQKYYRSGEGYFSSIEEDMSNGTVVKFTWEFEGQGTLSTSKTPIIVTQPGNVTQAAGTTFSLTVEAEGGTEPYTYQWKKGGVNISGATSQTYTKVGSVTGDSGSYTVVVTDAQLDTVTSSAATVSIT